ncbi:hypothetical protein SODALDRAFT_24299 [Sodiomyces alkalinus F11]|uniref:Uncharacterized protein n=1 Tax=Sodiomyces alkalinus (strain CBS 110278 / VKM F-3762 / F11) TaxID=1314773 RepID=A0A3N2Q7W3_SODAK|nr:hypothetical protein SODALDRAFT_24299 [Sodiomyces alkalinus F11]ROT42806.1 hypothetical protein SODALDRAFT_24299 [Sodiomyces alkalinus F11]
MYTDAFSPVSGYDSGFYQPSSIPIYSPAASSYNLPLGKTQSTVPSYTSRQSSGPNITNGSGSGSGSGSGPRYTSYTTPHSQPWDHRERFSPSDSVDDINTSPNLSDYSPEHRPSTTPPGKNKVNGKGRPQRRPSNRDEFDGPHQLLAPPPPDYIALQERELPHLPTHLLVQEQDAVLTQVNDRLSQCAYDFVAKYQFPIPLTQDMRPVERPQDREWTEWVYLLKRLATKRRIPARVLYNGQIKQFVTVLENSLEMRHASKQQSRPLKDDRNILQLISAGIQVAKILKDASAMKYLDQLYVQTEQQIQERVKASRFRQ